MKRKLQGSKPSKLGLRRQVPDYSPKVAQRLPIHALWADDGASGQNGTVEQCAAR